MRVFRGLRRKRPDGVICESNGAVLRRVDGQLRCKCPFACMAACEPCEFSGPCGHDHEGDR